MEALCERFTQQQGVQIKDDEREYILEAFRGDVDMLDQSDDEEYVDALDESRCSHWSIFWSVGANVESSDDGSEQPPDSDFYNSTLAVGYKSDKSFVVRGHKIGVFTHTNEDRLGNLFPSFSMYWLHLVYSTTITNVSTPNGVKFVPSKVS